MYVLGVGLMHADGLAGHTAKQWRGLTFAEGKDGMESSLFLPAGTPFLAPPWLQSIPPFHSAVLFFDGSRVWSAHGQPTTREEGGGGRTGERGKKGIWWGGTV